MTEKRFTIIDGIKKGTHSGIWDNQKQNNQRIGDELWVGEVVGMLNEGVMIVEENEQLKKDCTALISHNQEYRKENEQLKASLYAEKTNTAEVVNDYSKQFKRYSAQFSFMRDLADDLGVDVTTLEALDD